MKFFNLTNIFPKVINSEVLILQLQCVDFSSRTGKLMIGINLNSESLLNGSKMVHKTVVLILSFSTQCIPMQSLFIDGIYWAIVTFCRTITSMIGNNILIICKVSYFSSTCRNAMDRKEPCRYKMPCPTCAHTLYITLPEWAVLIHITYTYNYLPN